MAKKDGACGMTDKMQFKRATLGLQRSGQLGQRLGQQVQAMSGLGAVFRVAAHF